MRKKKLEFSQRVHQRRPRFALLLLFVICSCLPVPVLKRVIACCFLEVYVFVRLSVQRFFSSDNRVTGFFLACTQWWNNL